VIVPEDNKELWPQTVKVTVAPTKIRVITLRGQSHGENLFLVYKNLNPDSKLKYKAFLMDVAKAWATDQMVVAEPESDTDLVQPGPSTPTPRRPHVDPPRRLSGDMWKHSLMKIVKSENSKGKHPRQSLMKIVKSENSKGKHPRQYHVCAVHKKGV
jgi:hypothetical protein